MAQTADKDAAPAPGGAKRKTRTHGALLDAMLHLLEEKAFDQITIREITAQADVGYATFFRRYPDKEALLHDLAAQEIQSLLTMTLPIFYTADSEASTQALCAYVWKHKKLWRALLTGGAAAMLKEAYLEQALEVSRETFDPEAWLPVDLAVRFAVTSTLEVLSWWLKHPEPPAIREMASIINRLTVRPIFENGE
ncbi:TetR/AcrR family transcriptional regulator [Haliea sp. E17]|uniref:TetR/AcrR family transcriptional regulator n=1 Tax=Haliea sp. E17 TaxID=3401576 RepID=UPI003AAACEC9